MIIPDSISRSIARLKSFAAAAAAVMLLMSPSPAAADSFSLKGTVKDRLTGTMLFGAHARLLNPIDNSLLKEQEALKKWGTLSGGIYTETGRISEFNFNVPDRTKKYILEILKEGYESYRDTIDPAKFSRKLAEIDLGSIYMARKARKLDELTVTATKVKFYHKGDTLVYNADAFNLAEGSMLDAVIHQLPGVELKPDGRIYVNGRFVESLLLNGKDFFKGNNQLMLENIGAYTVKDIAIYDRQDDMDKIMGKDYGKKIYTMDVRLKKEYNQGLLANTEAGYGTKDRYLGRLFALWYADHARVSFFGNANNLSDNRKPGQDTGFTPATMNSGDYKNYSAGIDYWAEVPFKGISIKGNAEMNRSIVKRDKEVYTTNFLDKGNTYGYSFLNARLRSWDISTYHELDFQKTDWNLRISPSFKWRHNNNYESLVAATFSREWDNLDQEFLSSVYSSDNSGILSSLINRNIEREKETGHSIEAKLYANGKAKLANGTDAISYLLSGNYLRNDFDRFQRFMLNFGDRPDPADQADRYFRNRPDYRWNAKGALGYIWLISQNLSADMYYQIDHNTSREVSDLFRLDLLYSQIEENPFGWLPSALEYEKTIDPRNSFDSRKTSDLHTANINLSYRLPSRNLHLSLRLPLAFRHQRLRYHRGEIDSRITRDKFFLGNMDLEMNWNPKLGWIYFHFFRRVTSTDPVDMIEMRDDLNPLEIRLGNPGLKDMASHDFTLNLQRYNRQNGLQRSYSVSASFITDALAYGYSYDSATGVKSGRMYNVNGNWNISGHQALNFSFGPSKRFSFNNMTRLRYARNVDMLGEDKAEPVRNKVDNYNISESVSLDYSFAKSRVSLFGEAGWSRFSSRRRNFRSFNMTDFQYGVRGNFRLPYNFSISTDRTVYSRRGYSDPSLNTDNIVWNARLTYSVLKGSLLFMADGFDMLHNLSNVFYTVNAQARTETYTNVLPRYFMFHIQWKFHKKPRRHN